MSNQKKSPNRPWGLTPDELEKLSKSTEKTSDLLSKNKSNFEKKLKKTLWIDEQTQMIAEEENKKSKIRNSSLSQEKKNEFIAKCDAKIQEIKNTVEELNISLEEKREIINEIDRKIVQIKKIKEHYNRKQENPDFIPEENYLWKPRTKENQPKNIRTDQLEIRLSNLYQAYLTYISRIKQAKDSIQKGNNVNNRENTINTEKINWKKILSDLSDNDIELFRKFVLEKQKPTNPKDLDPQQFSELDVNEYALLVDQDNIEKNEKEYQDKLAKLEEEKKAFIDDPDILKTFDEEIEEINKRIKENKKGNKKRISKNIKLLKEKGSSKKFEEVAKGNYISIMESAKDRLQREVSKEEDEIEGEKRLDKQHKEEYVTLEKYIDIMQNNKEITSMKDILENPSKVNPLEAIKYLNKLKDTLNILIKDLDKCKNIFDKMKNLKTKIKNKETELDNISGIFTGWKKRTIEKIIEDSEKEFVNQKKEFVNQTKTLDISGNISSSNFDYEKVLSTTEKINNTIINGNGILTLINLLIEWFKYRYNHIKKSTLDCFKKDRSAWIVLTKKHTEKLKEDGKIKEDINEIFDLFEETDYYVSNNYYAIHDDNNETFRSFKDNLNSTIRHYWSFIADVNHDNLFDFIIKNDETKRLIISLDEK